MEGEGRGYHSPVVANFCVPGVSIADLVRQLQLSQFDCDDMHDSIQKPSSEQGPACDLVLDVLATTAFLLNKLALPS